MVIVAGVIVVMMWPSLRPVTPGTARARRGRPAALAATARAGLDAALIALGVLAFWELRRYSAVPRLSGGTLGIDPVLAVAPVLALAGIALLPLRMLPAAARLLDRLSTRGRRLAAALASWQVSRRARAGGQPGAAGDPGRGHRHAGAGPAPELAAVPAGPGGPDGRGRRPGHPARAAAADGRAGRSRRPPGVHTAMPVADFNSGFTVLALGARQAAATVLLRPDLSSLPPAQLWRRITPRTAGPGLGLPGPSGPARRRGLAAAVRRRPAGQRLRRAGRGPGQPVRAGRLGHRLRGPGRDAARRRTGPPADRRARRYGRGPLPAAAAGPVGELSAAGVPGAALPQRGGRARGAAGRAAPGGRPRHAGRPRPGGLPADSPAGSRPRSPGRASWSGGTRRPPPRISPTRGPTGSRPPSPPGGPAGTRPR